jgi:intracellular sulfur oxidation DsrE/DsrF family protein
MDEDWSGLAAAKAVWDFTTGDARRFVDRLDLVIDAAEDFGKRGIAVDFVVLLHAHATQFAARTLSGTKFESREVPDLGPIHARLERFTQVGGRIEVCRIAMDRSAIAVDNVIDCARVERNLFVNSVALQNRGYAYMPII